ncbi:MAG: hypothetical protein A2173_10650 [Planctomycetes bacterium RBG_13_44_8b]|nr:MAG: hypothetical protein A2173_10650 [Planctomycetes bacterium RBG_13_44_8b]
MFKKFTFLLAVILLFSPASYAVVGQAQQTMLFTHTPLLGTGLNGWGGSFQTSSLFVSQSSHEFSFPNNILPQQSLGLIGLPLNSTVMLLNPQLSQTTSPQMLLMMCQNPSLLTGGLLLR